MSATTDSKRRTAIEQLGGPNSAQMYYDADLGRPVVLREKEGWGISKRDYMKRTWSVLNPRCHVGEHGCELEEITQRTKLNRMDSDRYRTLPDETVDAILDTAVEKNGEWLTVHRPHIPFDGEGGVNVYLAGERLQSKTVEGPNTITVQDDPFEPDVTVCVEYGDEPGPVTATIGDESVTYERTDDPERLEDYEDGVTYRPEDNDDYPTVEIRLDTESEECGETEYAIPEAVRDE